MAIVRSRRHTALAITSSDKLDEVLGSAPSTLHFEPTSSEVGETQHSVILQRGENFIGNSYVEELLQKICYLSRGEVLPVLACNEHHHLLGECEEIESFLHLCSRFRNFQHTLRFTTEQSCELLIV